MTEAQLVVDEHGRLDIGIGEVEGCANSLRREPSASYVFVRQYSSDWPHGTPARLTIEAVDEPSPYRAPLTLDALDRGLARAARFVSDAAAAWAVVVDQARTGPANVFTTVAEDMDMTLPSGHRFAFGHFALRPDEALVVEFTPADVPYWGLTINNYWFEVVDYGERGAHLNNATATREPDGRVRAVICPSLPAAPNWIDTRGHLEGALVFRWSRTALPIPAIETRVVPVSSLAGT